MPLRTEIHLFSFLLIELSSPVRTREHISSGGEPSTSGRQSTLEVRQYGTLWENRRAKKPNLSPTWSNSGLSHEKNYEILDEFHGIFYKENDHLLPIEHNFAMATTGGYVLGVVINGIIRPIYNKNKQVIVVRERDRQEMPITLQMAEERFGVNNRLPDKHFD